MSNNFEKSRETLRERASVLYSTGDLSDCEFLVGENEIRVPAHRIFMAIASPVFFAMFYGDMAERNNAVRIKDIEPPAFKGMLQYIYTDRVEFESVGHACEVYVAAKKYLLPFLEAQCELHIEAAADAASAVELYEFATFHGIKALEAACIDLFRSETRAVLESAGFLEAELATVETLADQDCLSIASELELFNGVEEWACKEADRQGTTLDQLVPELNDVMAKIRFLSLTADEFATAPGLSPLLSTDERLAIAMNITRPGAAPYPERLCPIATGRKPEPVVEPFEEEWSMSRDCEESALFSVTKWNNPFPRKGITVSRPIKLRGLKVSAQKKTASSSETLGYQEKVTIVLKKDWALKFSGALYHSMTQYNTEMTIIFQKPILMEPDRLYWLIIQFDKPGTYLFAKDVNTVYRSHGIEVKMSDDFSSITQLLFTDIPPPQPAQALVPATSTTV